MKSQNLIFEAEIPSDLEFEHPAGAWLARQLLADLNALSWKTQDFDNWRDYGWSISCSKDDTKLLICYAPYIKPNEWFLQITSEKSMGLLGRLLGRQSPETDDQIFSLARIVHELLKDKYHYSIVGWKIDGPPDSGGSSDKPKKE